MTLGEATLPSRAPRSAGRAPSAAGLAPSTHRGEDRVGATLGMTVLLASWAMVFLTLFLAYVILRVRQPMWPPPGAPEPPIAFGAANTLVLLASSLALARGSRRMTRADGGAGWIWTAIALGAAFLALQWRLWQTTWSAGLLPASGSFGSIFYTLTAFHAVHVVGGLGALVWLAGQLARGRVGAERQTPIVVVSMFWHFVDVVWVSMFVAVFVW